jgi:hypothetical protein
MGLVFAPAAGAMAGDYLSHRGQWVGVRRGLHPPGLIAWMVGLAVRLILDLLAQRGLLPVPSLTASPIAGLLAAALTYWILARAGLERSVVPIETFPAASGAVPAAAGRFGDLTVQASG